jgi:hypothetical protein
VRGLPADSALIQAALAREAAAPKQLPMPHTKRVTKEDLRSLFGPAGRIIVTPKEKV